MGMALDRELRKALKGALRVLKRCVEIGIRSP